MSPRSPRPADTSGFTLVELLVAMTLTLVLSAAAMTAFQQAIRMTTGTVDRFTLQEQVRTALDLLVRDAIQVGDGLPNGKIIPLPNGDGARQVRRPGPNLDPFPADTSDISAVLPGPRLGPVVNGVRSDVLTLLSVDASFVMAGNQTFVGTMAANGRSLTFTDPADDEVEVDVRTIRDPLRTGDLVMVVSGAGTAMLMVTGFDGDSTALFADGDPMDLNQPDAPSGSLSQISPSPGDPFTVTARRVRMITYWIEEDGENLQLVRQINMRQPQRVALGIESLQFTYDIVDGSLATTGVREPESAMQIRKINIFLAARSARPSPQTRQFQRTSLSTQVSLRSLALVDRYL
jgi:prepilin-type N-terminal cleavage/methylation domain-containing protein